jgi:hypothetical protein
MREKDRKALEALAGARPEALDPTRLAGSPRQHQDLAELMAAQPAQTTTRRVLPRRRVLIPLVGVAAAAAVAIGAVAVGITHNEPARTTAAGPDGHLVLLTMADSVQNQASSGSYWQFETQNQDLSLILPTEPVGAEPYVVAETSQGSWSIGVRPGEQSLMVSGINEKRGPWTAADTHRWLMAGSPVTVNANPGFGKGKTESLQEAIGGGSPRVDRTDYGGNIAAVGPNNVNYAYLQQLPGDQAQLAQLLAKLYQRDGGESDTDQQDWMFQQVGGLITLPVSSAVRAAAYRVLAALPGITSLGTVSDPLGRTGVGVALPPRPMGDLGEEQQQLIVDPDTSTILSQQTVLVRPTQLAIAAGMKSGTALNYTATTHIGWTDQQVEVPTTR